MHAPPLSYIPTAGLQGIKSGAENAYCKHHDKLKLFSIFAPITKVRLAYDLPRNTYVSL